jgi:DNA-directed RNA polymerase specialized sigma24 family protein
MQSDSFAVGSPDRSAEAVGKPSVRNIEPRKDWTLTPSAFHKLLNWLGDWTSAGEHSYLEMRQRLVAYFDRKNCPAPDELADETLNRVARRLEEEVTIISDTPAHYCYIVARYVFMEYWRGMRRNEVPLDAVLRQSAENSLTAPELEDAESREKLTSCLDLCTEKLEPLSRELIIRYYFGERRIKIENRRALAAELGVSINALSIRACRIRDKLEACIQNCVGQ